MQKFNILHCTIEAIFMAEPDPDCLTNYYNTRVNYPEYQEVDSNNAQELQMT